MYMVGNITYQIVLLVHSMLVHLWSKMTSKPHPNAQRYKMYFLTVYMLNMLKSGKKCNLGNSWEVQSILPHGYWLKAKKKLQKNTLQLLRINCTFFCFLSSTLCGTQSVSISPILFCILYFVLYFRTEWRSELDRPRKWRIRVTQIPCDCKDNEDPGMELAPAGNLWILWAVLYLVYNSTGCTIWRG